MNLDISFLSDQNTLWAEIAMENSTLMAECNGIHNLIEITLDDGVWEDVVCWQSSIICPQVHPNIVVEKRN